MNAIKKKKMNEIYQQKMERYSEEYVFENCEREGEVFIVKDAYQNGFHNALQNQWISVEEALPEEEKKVLVTHQYGCQVAAFYKDGAHSYWGVAKERPIGASITHWMPIPELKGGRNEKDNVQ